MQLELIKVASRRHRGRIAAALLLAGLSLWIDPLGAAPQGQPCGRIFDREVALDDFRDELKRLRRQRGPRFSAQALRVRMIYLATARREGLTVPPEVVQQRLEREVRRGLRILAVNAAVAEEPVPVRRRKLAKEAERRFDADWRFTPEAEKRYLEAAESTAEDFRRWMAEDALISAWMTKGRAELDGRALAQLELAERRARVRVERIRIPARPDAVPFEPPSEGELQAHFTTMQAELVQGRRVLAGAVVMPAAEAEAAAKRWQRAAGVAPVVSRAALLARLFGARPGVEVAAPALGPVDALAGPDWLRHPKVRQALKSLRPRRVSEPIPLDDGRAALVRVELVRRAGVPTFAESRAAVLADWRSLTALGAQLGPAHDLRRRLNRRSAGEPVTTPESVGLETEELPEFSLAEPPAGITPALVEALRRARLGHWILSPALASRELWLLRVRSRTPLDRASITPTDAEVRAATEAAMTDRSFLALCRARGITEDVLGEARRLAPERRLTVRRLAPGTLSETDQAAFLAGRLSLTRLAKRAGVKVATEAIWPQNALVSRLDALANREITTVAGPRGPELWTIAEQPSPNNVRAVEVRRARAGPKPAGPHREGPARSVEALARQDRDDPLARFGGWIGALQLDKHPREVELRRTLQGSEPGDRWIIKGPDGPLLVEVLNALPVSERELRKFDHRFERLLPFFQTPSESGRDGTR